MRHAPTLPIALLLGVLVASGCNRNIEPFDPDERPTPPDLSRIFPPGAELARADAQPGDAPPAPDRTGGRGAPPVASGAPIRGTVELDARLEGRVPANAVLFIVARSQGGGPPVAVLRIPSPVFPLEFRVGPEDRMIEAIPFAGPMTISARVDSDGNAMSRSPGDLQGAAPGPVEPGARGVSVVIDEVL